MTDRQKVALVTGGSAGLGAAMARELARRHWTVFAGSRSGKTPASDGDLRPLVLDVTSDESVTAGIAHTLEAAGCLDLVINNAGINFSGPFEEQTLEQASQVLETNVLGVARVTRAALAPMRARRQGTILTIGSLAGIVAPPGEAYYAASKFALEGLLEALHHEVRRFNVRILLAEPGYISTDFANPARDAPPTIPDYDRMRGVLHAHWRRSIQRGMNVDRAARKIVNWAERPGRSMRKRFGWDAQWIPIARAIIPESLFFHTTRWIFGISS